MVVVRFGPRRVFVRPSAVPTRENEFIYFVGIVLGKLIVFVSLQRGKSYANRRRVRVPRVDEFRILVSLYSSTALT